MPYTPVPNAGQSLGQTRDQIRNNIADLKSSLANNHVDLDNGANTGKHKYMQMPAQGSAPSTAAAEGGLYTKDVGTGITQLFYRRESNGTEVRVTGQNSNAISGYTYLANGLLLQWGQTARTGANTTVGFPVSFTAVYQVVANIETFVTTYGVNALASNNFNFASAAGGSSIIHWMAIGTTSGTI